MDRFFFVFAVLVFLGGCSSYQPFTGRELTWQMNAPNAKNPIYVQSNDHEFLWSVVVDVVDAHFEIAREEPVRLYDNVLTEGRLDTKPKIAASITEFWHADSVGLGERIDCTFQTIRKKALVRVVPVVGGFQIEVFVHKELEDLKAPAKSPTTNANLRYRSDTDPFVEKVDIDPASKGWIMQGRDTAMEDRLLLEILYRLEHPSKFIRKQTESIRG
jgi:hypothetical protein